MSARIVSDSVYNAVSFRLQGLLNVRQLTLASVLTLERNDAAARLTI